MSPVRSNFSSAKGKTPSAWFLNPSVTIQCATSGRRQEMVRRARNSIAEDFLFTRLRDNSETREAPGRITSASPTSQSICTVPHWITSFSARPPISTRMSTAPIIKPFARTDHRDFWPSRYIMCCSWLPRPIPPKHEVATVNRCGPLRNCRIEQPIRDRFGARRRSGI